LTQVLPTLNPKFALDRAVLETQEGSSRASWSRASSLSVLGTATLIAVAVGINQARGSIHKVDTVSLSIGLLVEMSLALLGYLLGRTVLGENGWSRALGWDRPRWKDTLVALGWLVLQKVTLILVVFLFSAISRGLTVKAASNTAGLLHVRGWSLAIYFVAAVFVAPVAEETIFRGILLRAGMRRWGFVRAAFASSLIFGLLHSYEAHSIGGAIELATLTAVFGFGQCLLVRATGRLFPAILVHAGSNLLTVILLAT
jgi:membrane protease YdiL (CAAX protease family)